MIIKSYEQFYNLLNNKLSKKKNLKIMLTGGNSISPFYRYLNKKFTLSFLNHINFYLTDERIYENKKYTNQYNIERILFKGFKKSSYKIIKMYEKDKNVQENIQRLNKKMVNMDLIFLSFANDGHISSLFPNNKTQINSSKSCFVYNKNNQYQFRLSVSYAFLKKNKNKFFFFIGKEKKNLYKKILSKENDFDKKNLAIVKNSNLLII